MGTGARALAWAPCPCLCPNLYLCLCMGSGETRVKIMAKTKGEPCGSGTGGVAAWPPATLCGRSRSSIATGGPPKRKRLKGAKVANRLYSHNSAAGSSWVPHVADELIHLPHKAAGVKPYLSSSSDAIRVVVGALMVQRIHFSTTLPFCQMMRGVPVAFAMRRAAPAARRSAGSAPRMSGSLTRRPFLISPPRQARPVERRSYRTMPMRQPGTCRCSRSSWLLPRTAA